MASTGNQRLALLFSYRGRYLPPAGYDAASEVSLCSSDRALRVALWPCVSRTLWRERSIWRSVGSVFSCTVEWETEKHTARFTRVFCAPYTTSTPWTQSVSIPCERYPLARLLG